MLRFFLTFVFKSGILILVRKVLCVTRKGVEKSAPFLFARTFAKRKAKCAASAAKGPGIIY